jgi:hypothetical protein
MAPLPIHRSDEFRTAISWHLARRQSLPPLRPFVMLECTFVDVQRIVQRVVSSS